MKRSVLLAFFSSVALLAAQPNPSVATTFGTLSNFDVVNDTPTPCHGFEIELEDLHPADVVYTFGGTYIRYGMPEVLDTTVDPAHPRVLVRYRHWNGSQWEATPIAPPNITPGGHDCYANGPVGNYLDSGCEHYGVSLSATPTQTTYRWIVATDPNDANSAFTTVPQAVNLPVPVWNVAPRPVAVGGGVNVRVEVEPVEEEQHTQHGEPQWMRVFKVESDLDLQPEDVVKLLLGGPDNILPGETEIETEWKLIQSKPGDAEGEEEDAEVKEDPLDDGKHSVIRRYEFYRYTGPRDPENNEALPCIHDDEPVPADAPVEGCSDLGEFVGAQNVAVDVDLTTTEQDLPPGEVGVPYESFALVVGGLPPYLTTVTVNAVPDGLLLDSATGVLSGTPTAGGEFSFTIHAEDSATDTVDGTYNITIVDSGAPTPTDTPNPTETGAAPPTETPTETATELASTPTETAEATETEVEATETPTEAVSTPTETATEIASTPTETAEATETELEATETPTGVAATPTETSGTPPTATATAPTEICTGDCGGEGTVTVDELIKLINIALGTKPPSECAQGIPPDEPVDIALLVRAVGNALTGCEGAK